MRAELQSAGQKDGLAFLRTAAESGGRCTVAYGTRTGALLRVNGVAAGAFDREHATMICDLPANADMTLEVELRALPTNGLPSGPGLRWWLMNLLATQRPAQTLTMIPADAAAEASGERATLPLIGHSHLDVGWLWTYAQTRRKAMRTFAIAVNLLEQYPQFQFSQSQAQLYDFVRDDDSELFERVRALAAQDRFDVSVAALWVESDCNLPSGESLLRQMLSAHRFCREHFNRTPEVAWLPDSFGFANTLPTLLAHAEIRYFVTTKLQWNDTTLFPHPQFRWHGPDGSEVVAALIDSYDGGLNPWRVARARSRGEPLVAGYGDGGGGVTDEMIRQATHVGRWIRPIDWLRTLDANSLPQHQDELYLEYHRGVYTTHHNIKQRNAQLERKLGEAECAVARCIANRTVSSDIRESCREIDAAWLLVLRNQFHDVLPGTSIAEVYADVHQEYDRAERLIERVMQRAYDVIPPRGVAESRCVVPEAIAGGAYLFDNGLIEARVLADGSIDLLRTSGGPNVVSRANLLMLYRDVPREWDAWNIDADYRNQKWLPRIERCTADGETLVVQLIFGKSRFAMRVCLREGEPFLRITLRGDWFERHTLLRCENALIVDTDRVIYGTPHGTIERPSLAQTPQERAKFEVPGQRFAVARSQQGGTAVFSLDTYGWSASRDGRGLHLGHSLLRSPMWPQRDADAGSQMLTYALAPLDNASLADVERLWLRFAEQTACTLFEIDQRNVLVVACKPTHEGDRAIVRIRECDGVACRARVRCEQRFTSVERVNALEERIDRIASNDDASFEAAVSPYELQSFRVQF